MSPNRMLKGLWRRIRVLWRDQPTQYEIEALEANVRRVGLVIRIRWTLVLALILFSVAAGIIYTVDGYGDQLRSTMLVPAVALAFVMLYNLIYQLEYRRWGNVAVFNHLQLLLDMAVVAVLVYYSGGIYSWFHSMFLLFILEAALILPRRRHVWAFAGVGAVLYAGILLGELTGVLPHVNIPFYSNTLQTEPGLVLVRFLWVVTVMAGTALVSQLMVAEWEGRNRELAEATVVDPLTKLSNRPAFLRFLRTETVRAERSDRVIALVLIDIDRFDEINRGFGFTVGNDVLRKVADALRNVVVDGLDEGFDIASVFRYGGEEFAVVLPLDRFNEISPEALNRARRLAEELRGAVASVRHEDRRVTGSLGVALFPRDGDSAESLMHAADVAVQAAFDSGGNSVSLAADVEVASL